jgi:hypothetical protein
MSRMALIAAPLAATALAAVGLAATFPAAAAHCPQGQLYRVRLHECVDLHSRLALAYERPPPRPAPKRPPARPAPPAERLVLPLLDREWPAAWPPVEWPK